MCRLPGWLLAAWGLVVGLLAVVGRAHDDSAGDDQLRDFRPGLLARYTGADGQTHERRDEAIQFVWQDRPPDPRVPVGGFSAQWRGRLLAVVPGTYQLHLYAAGEVRLTLAGKTLLAGSTDEPGWLDSEPVELAYGDHALELTYRKTGDVGRLGLFWSGPQFPLEPVPAHNLVHAPRQAPAERFEQGQLLVRAFRCGACHEVAGVKTAPAAPALARLPGNISDRWLADWLVGADPGAPLARRMPDFALTADEAQAIAAYLLSPSPLPAALPDAVAHVAGLPPDADAGRRLFHTLGCLACHRVGQAGSQELFGGGDLSAVADKRPPGFFALWLEDPARLNPAHRMPVFKLELQERTDLAAYLATLRADRAAADDDAGGRRATDPTASQIDRGRRLVEEYRCGACHSLPHQPAIPPIQPRRLAGADWNGSCLGRPDPARRRPGYCLSSVQRQAVQAYFDQLARTRGAAPARPEGRLVLAERNCLGCHARGLAPGIASLWDPLVAAHPDLAPMLPAMSPPALTAVGDKLRDEAIEAAVTLRHPPLRPWLAIRMPRYDLEPGEMEALAGHFVDEDRIPERPAAERATPDEAALVVAGSRLVTSDGFGCTSCHKIGDSAPAAVAPAAHGTDLSLVGGRIRRPWYDRFLRNPARIVPRMEMPSIQLPVRGVLADDVDDQLSAVWHVLNQEGFDPPQPNPVRVVRARNVPGSMQPALALTDVVEAGERVFVKPLVVGLANRHNVLVDLETNRLAAWWIGDTARERTRGKQWYWEPGGTPVLPATAGTSELVLVHGGRKRPPAVVGQFAADLDWFEQSPGGLRFAYRLRFGSAAGDPPVIDLRVMESFTAIAGAKGAGTRTGFRRRVEIEGVPAGDAVELAVVPSDSVASADDRTLALGGAPGLPRARVRLRHGLNFDDQPAGVVSLRPGQPGDPVACELDYVAELAADQFPVEAPPAEPSPPARLSVVPGYEVVRLPLGTSEMPTGLAWRGDGTLVFSSLKGQVWLARDTDGDGLEDRQAPFSDELAAPYGVAVYGEAIDVINKYGLLRLYDRDADGRADRTEVVASGWGHTADYHDWAVGLVRDEEGNYYVGLPCQQDDRSPAGAHLRGTVLKLVPREPTRSEPRAYSIEPLCAGLRFPMGLAIDRSGALFAADNQGNYNPFNELNHLVPGARYGFINQVESRSGLQPPFREPAIDIPHPWTRSVNGICFLDTPPAVRERLGHDLFGPFEGHLVGCEYDTRRLVRMSLDKVGDTYQGAVYPFSIEPAAGAETFEGPIVCQVAPHGDLYVGNLRDSGWGAGQNTGSIARLRPTGSLPLGIAEVRAGPAGFTIDFTAAVRADEARQAANYRIVSYRRVSTPAYGGPDMDLAPAGIRAVELSPDARRVELVLDQLRPGFVYELRILNLAPPGELLHPAEAYYTLRRIPPGQ